MFLKHIHCCRIPLLQVPGHQSVFINEPRLSDFKQVLLREGIQAEFVGGVLVCNNMVAVRRVSARLSRTGTRLFFIWRLGSRLKLVMKIFTFKISSFTSCFDMCF